MAEPQAKGTEEWTTSAQDALRVALIATDVERGNEVDKWNVEEGAGYKNTSKKEYSVIDSNPYDVAPAPEYEEQVPLIQAIVTSSSEFDSTPVIDTSVPTVVFYTPCDDFAKALVNALEQSHPNTQFIRYEETNANHFGATALDVSTFIVNMTDEDSSDLLDKIIDEHGDKSTLFLCETTMGDKCIDKAQAFLSTNQFS